MSSWYTTRDSSTWFEASDAQAWIPSTTQNSSSSVKYSLFTVPQTANDLVAAGGKNLKTPKSNVEQRMSKEIKLEYHQTAVPPQIDKFIELPSNSVSDQNAWNAYVLSNSSDDFLSYWDSPSPTTENQLAPIKPEKEVFSKLKRNVEIEEELTKQNRFKTELCQSWISTGNCRYGTKCQFAHGKDELRSIMRHPKYKTEICKTFSTTGQCPYGNRCRFVHQLAELRGDTEEEEITLIQMKLKEINLSLAPDPVFPSSGNSIPTAPATVKKGSRLPFLQKLRKQL